jgi:bile acid:Na+ symporter, BASS family
MTLAIEIGVHNATMATFLTLSVLKSIELAITPTLYGCVMVVNATLLIRWCARRHMRLAVADRGQAAT